jgi:hypothetical protein
VTIRWWTTAGSTGTAIDIMRSLLFEEQQS